MTKERPARHRRPDVEKLESRTYLAADPTVAALAAASDFNIDLYFTDRVFPEEKAIFEEAAQRWESIILGDIPSAFVGGLGTVDDLAILADVRSIDGPSNTLGFAGPQSFRPGSQNYLPSFGTMTFDSADIGGLIADGSFLSTVVHEMGHVLGIGTIWDIQGRLAGDGTSSPRFIGARAADEFNRLSKANETTVDVESNGGSGTAYGHWRESAFGNELMTGFLNNGDNPLSRMTAASLADLGYPNVNVDGADLYELPSFNPNRNRLPTVGSLSSSADASGVRLGANNVRDSDGSVSRVSFYRETNGLPGLQAGTNAPDQLVGVDTNGVDGWAVTAAAASLPDGNSTYYVRANDNNGAYSGLRSANQVFARDSVAPLVTSSGFEYQTRQAVRFDFGEAVTNLTASSLTVVNRTTGQTMPAGSFVLDADSTSTRAVFRFANGVMPDGDYTATISPDVTDAAGNRLGGNREASFFVLAGDANHDRLVNLSDFIILRRNLGVSAGATFGTADFTYDGRVNLSDFIILRRQLGISLPAPSQSLFSDKPVDDSDDAPA